MENFPKKRGRPRKIPEPLTGSFGAEAAAIPDTTREYFAEILRTDRTRANAYYAEMAREVVEHESKHVYEPHNPVLAAKLRLGMDWIMARRTVLTELGRMMDGNEDPTPGEVQRFIGVVRHIAARYERLTAKAACAYIKGRRMGGANQRERIASLHHDLNAAINVHRQRYPESTWSDVRRTLELTVQQIERKLH